MKFWNAGEFLCRLLGLLYVYGLYVSAGIIISITWDRYKAVCAPFHITEAKRRAKKMLSWVWIGSLLASLPEVHSLHVFNNL